MRIAHSVRGLRKASFASVLMVLSVVTFSTSVFADQPSGLSYFKGVSVPPGQLLDTSSYPGTNAIYGSVMPNRDPTMSTYNGGAGAVGTKALGIYESDPYGIGSNNRARKEALYNFLRAKYNGSGSEVASWEKMGATVIAHQMLGKEWGAGSRTVTNNEWTELYNRLVEDSSLIMSRNRNYVNNLNSAGIRYDGEFDAIRWQYFDNSPKDSWVFTVNGNEVYALEIICANPLGSFSGLPELDYSLTPSITTPEDGAVVNPGQSISINDNVQNSGPDPSQSALWRLTVLTFRPGTTISAAQKVARTVDNDVCASFSPLSTNRLSCEIDRNPARQVFLVGQTDRSTQFRIENTSTDPIIDYTTPGTRICFVSSVSPPDQGDILWRHSAMRCVTVASSLQFELEPKVLPDRVDGSIVEPGVSGILQHAVTNLGQDSSSPTIWRLTRMVYDPTAAFGDNTQIARDGASIGDDPCSSFTDSGRTECGTVLGQESPDAIFAPGVSQTFDPVSLYSIPDVAPVGTRVCFVSSVSRPKPDVSPAWSHSAMWCLKVGKKPKMQVWGGDVRAGGKIDTSISTVTSIGNTYGSWAEYGALSNERNSGFASGSGLNNGNGGDQQSLWDKLTFANTGDSSTGCEFGCYGFTLRPETLTSQFVAGTGPVDISGSRNLNDLNGAYVAGNLTILESTIASGRSVTIVATGTVTIVGNIEYADGPYTSIRDIPQVVIKAPTVNISNSAGRVDAWLLAVNESSSGTGVLNTCSDEGTEGALTVNTCSNGLVINGPVVADTVYLRRTAGSGGPANERGNPAEIFNLRADAYLWAYIRGANSSRVQTVHTKELSPRF